MSEISHDGLNMRGMKKLLKTLAKERLNGTNNMIKMKA